MGITGIRLPMIRNQDFGELNQLKIHLNKKLKNQKTIKDKIACVLKNKDMKNKIKLLTLNN